MTTSTAPNKDVVEKIAKLLALANKNDNAHQAEAAMAKATQLAMEHNLCLQSIEKRKDNATEAYIRGFYHEGAKASPERKYIWDIVEKYFSVAVITHKDVDKVTKKKLSFVTFVGSETNVKIAEYAYRFLQRTFKELWEQEKIKRGWSLRDKRYRSSFYQGLRGGFIAKMKETQAQVEQTMAMVLVRDPNIAKAVDEQVGKLVKTYNYIKPRHNSNEVRAVGFQRGQEISLNPALKEGEYDEDEDQDDEE